MSNCFICGTKTTKKDSWIVIDSKRVRYCRGCKKSAIKGNLSVKSYAASLSRGNKRLPFNTSFYVDICIVCHKIGIIPQNPECVNECASCQGLDWHLE
jgi:hypothetical protein